MPKQIIDAWPHVPSSRATIPSGADPANPNGWADNLDLIAEVLNGRMQEPAGVIPNGAVIYYNTATGMWTALAPGAADHVLTIVDGVPTWAPVSTADPDKLFNITHEWAIPGEVKVASGSTDYILPFQLGSLATGQTAKLKSIICYLQSGTSATIKLARKPWSTGEADLGAPYTGIAVTTTPQEVTGDVTLAAKDRIRPVVTAVSGTPTNMILAIVIEYTQ